MKEQLEHVGAFSALIEEIRELKNQPGHPLRAILSTRGIYAYEPPESVPNWSDDAVKKSADDLLGRTAFARFLAKRIASISPDSDAYAMHIYAPWGAGKSTVLNLMRNELQKEKVWLTVEFNAWRHQHIQPPWWSLMEIVFKETKKELKPWDRFREYVWRFNTGRLEYLIGFIVLIWILALVVFPMLRSNTNDAAWGLSAAAAENASKILALIATIWGGIFAFNRSVLFSSARAAQSYTELTRDPTGEIKNRFGNLMKRLRPKRVVIFIDDLDRCQSKYVVELLEGIQTLFREAHVIFVIAADRHWLNACYEEIYEKLKPEVHEPGKPLGTLFLEKAFRFSTPLPGIPEGLKSGYWLYLLQVSPTEKEADLGRAKDQGKTEVSKVRSEGEALQLIDASRGRSFEEQRAIREEVAVQLADTKIAERLEHTLRPYNDLLALNPRSMKQLVNSYIANRALAILSEVDIIEFN